MTVSRIPNVEGGIQPTIVTAKGDLIAAVANANPARLGVGSDGQLLTADSTASTGLSYQNNFAAGKNKIINGDFGIWQRGTSFSNPNNVYTADRWVAGTDATCTVSQQTFTPATAPVSGYEGTYYYRAAKSAGGTYFQANQKIEDVRAFAGQAITVSFWAKADSAITLAVQGYQNFGSGGSSQVTALNTSVTLTTSWARYSVTATLPSISGKTIGTSSYLMLPYFIYSSSSAATIDFWGVQVEAGSTATAFQTATGTIQGELAACQRYCINLNAVNNSDVYFVFGNGYVNSTTQIQAFNYLPVAMRVAPSATISTTANQYAVIAGSSTVITCSAAPTLQRSSTTVIWLVGTVSSGLTVGQAGVLISNATNSPTIILSAEL